MVVVVDGIQEFDLLSQRIHPAASRVELLARGVPRPSWWPSTSWPRATRRCWSCRYEERRERLAALVAATRCS